MPEFVRPEWLALIAVAAAAVILSLRGAVRSQPRRVIAGTLRVLTLAALAIALAAPLAGSRSRHADVVFALDYSRSIDRESVFLEDRVPDRVHHGLRVRLTRVRAVHFRGNGEPLFTPGVDGERRAAQCCPRHAR